MSIEPSVAAPRADGTATAADPTRLRQRIMQLETLIDRAPLGIYTVDADFRIREANPVALAVYGDIPGGVIGRDFAEIMHIMWAPAYAEEVVRIFRHTLATGESYVTPRRAEPRLDRGVTEFYEWQVDRVVQPDGRFGLVCYFKDIAERVQAETTRQLLINELNHRVKNTLASVQAITQQTLRTTREPADFAKRLTGRIQSLARAHSLLTDANWQGADLRELILDQLLHGSVGSTRVTAWGPATRLAPPTALHLALVLHELGTNAAKYGALSRNGWVTVSWTVQDGTLALRWVERGGPPVAAPTARGFGTTLIEHSAKSLGGRAQMRCERDGITWEISLALPQAEPGSDPAALLRAEAANRASRATAEDAVGPRAPLDSLRLLVVEDEPLIALDLADRLQRAGAEVAPPLGSEREALALIESTAFDAAVLDANLHGRPVEPIAAALIRRNIPFVVVTGYGRDGLGSTFPHVPVLTKPVTDEQLIAAVDGLVRRRGNVVAMRS
jgi:PAS domain S-box-containing protein